MKRSKGGIILPDNSRQAFFRPFKQQQQEYGEAVSGFWDGEPIVDDWVGGAAAVGQLGWVPAAAGTGAVAILNGAQNRSCNFIGGFSITGGATLSTGVEAVVLSVSPMVYPASLSTLTLSFAMTYIMEWRIAFDTAFPTVAQQYRTLIGVFDSAAASTAGNFIGVEVTGTAGVGGNFRGAYGTAAAPTYVDTGIAPVNLDYAYNVRMVLSAFNVAGTVLFGALNIWVNNVNMNPNNVPLLNAASGITFPAIIAGFPGIKVIGVAGAAGTGFVFVDAFEMIVQGRTKN